MPLTTFICPVTSPTELIDAYHTLVEHNTLEQQKLGSYNISAFTLLNPTSGCSINSLMKEAEMESWEFEELNHYNRGGDIDSAMTLVKLNGVVYFEIANEDYGECTFEWLRSHSER